LTGKLLVIVNRSHFASGERINDGTVFYFLIAVVAAIAASGVVGLFLTNFIIGRFKISHRAKKERLTNHRLWRFEGFSRHQTQARLSAVLFGRDN
jgi:hypothetical protein